MEKYFQKEIECASREEITKIQNEKLTEQVKHVWNNVPYYRKKMEKADPTVQFVKTEWGSGYSFTYPPIRNTMRAE